jgi:putative hydrolase of the HAD superfamily
MYSNIKVIGFDADDTLWVNEPFFRESERRFCGILKPYVPEETANAELFKTEMRNMPLYGYGAKAFILSLIETAVRISGNKITANEIQQIIDLGKEQLNRPVVLLDGAENVLRSLQSHYRLILATKGDLLDQERKLEKSGLAPYFHHIEIMSDKQPENYRKLIKHLDIAPNEFVMIGNSVKSDILPVLEIGGKAIHVPFEITWEHEQVHENNHGHQFHEVEKLSDILRFFIP